MCKPTELKTVFKTVESALYKTGRWTDEEHEVFVKAMRQYGKNWKEVSRAMKTRSPVQVRTHAQKFFLKAARADLQDGKQIPIEFTSLKKDTAILSSCLEFKVEPKPELGFGGESELTETEKMSFHYIRDIMAESDSASSSCDEEEEKSSDDMLSQSHKFLLEDKEENFNYNDLFMEEFESFTCKTTDNHEFSSDEEKDDLSVSSILNDPNVGVAAEDKSSHVKRSHDFDAPLTFDAQDVKKIRVDYPHIAAQPSRNFDDLSFADFEDSSYGFNMDPLNREGSFLAGFEDLLY